MTKNQGKKRKTPNEASNEDLDIVLPERALSEEVTCH